MSLSEFQTVYLSQQPILWLALAVMVGVFIGVRIGRILERARLGKKPSAVDVPRESGDDLSAAIASVDAPAAEDADAPQATPVQGFQIRDLVGIDDKQVKALSAHGIAGVAQLREATATKGARESLADELQLEDFVVNKWARMADFLSLDAMTPEVAEFLVFAGINSTTDLASRNPESVAHKLQNLNDKESRIEAVPTRQQLETWVAALKE